jgi:ParB family transcriptional regulator, chromosome partitioning protein
MTTADRVSLTPTAAAASTRFKVLPLEQLESREQVRKIFVPESLQRLADSLRAEGQLQPIIAFYDASREKHVIIAGERRFRAAGLAGLKTLEAVCFDREPTPAELAAAQLIENCLRDALNPIELANGFDQVMRAGKISARELARQLNIASTTVTRALSLLDLPGDVQESIACGELPTAFAREIARLPEEGQRRELLEQIKNQDLRASDVARLVSRILKPKRRGAPKGPRKDKETFRQLGDGYEATVSPRKLTLATKSKGANRGDLLVALEALLKRLRTGGTVDV